jgi:hypothetical protein
MLGAKEKIEARVTQKVTMEFASCHALHTMLETLNF